MRHGYYGTPANRSWAEMKRRCNCTNKKRKCYATYAARGISYIKRWEKFENFLLDMGERPVGTSLDRIDNNKGYSKKNCRWATNIQQQLNKRNLIKRNFNNQEYISHKALANAFKIHPATLSQRLNNNWSLEKALTTKPGKNGKK